MTGWVLCDFRTQCAVCGQWANRVWRYFKTETTSTLHVCEACAKEGSKP